MGNLLEISVARRKCLCVSGKVVLWSAHFDIIVLVPMFYMKLCNHIYIYIDIHRYYTIVKELASLLRNHDFSKEVNYSFREYDCSKEVHICFENMIFVRTYDFSKTTIYLHGAH